MKILKSIESGRRAFILGNGPSIKNENLRLLRDELVIGMNASTLLEKEHGFYQSYYVCSDTRFISHPEKRMWATSELDPRTKRILRSELRDLDDPSLESRTWYIPAISRDGFSENIAAGYFYGCTTTMMAIQVAYYLGVRDVYLLGVDLRYSEEHPRFYREENPQLEDANTSVQLYNIVKSNDFFSGRGGKFVNCSSNSFLAPYLKTVNFQDVINNC